MPRQNGEVLRTYKAGLKLPASLVDPFTQLVREREMLQFLLKGPNTFSKSHTQQSHGVTTISRTSDRKWECFKVQKNLGQAKEAIKNEYKKMFTQYKGLSFQDLEKLLRANHQQIAFFTRTNLQYDVNLKLQGQIHQPAKPTPREISLRDYQNLTRHYLKRLCGNSRKYALENIEHLPRDEPLTERKVTTLLGHKANHLHSVSTQMAAMMNVGNTIRRKVEEVKKLFQSNGVQGPGFRDVLPVYIAFYSVPIHFRNYLAHAWQVDGPWVRNTLVGWRRKVDPWLPKKVQVEPLTTFMADLARYCGRFCREERERKIIGILQHKHVLHLLLTNIPLHSLLPLKYRKGLTDLRKRIVFSPEIQETIAEVTSRINLGLFTQLTGELSAQVRATMAALEATSPSFKRTLTFLNKLDLLQTHMAEFQALLHQYIPGNRYTASAAKIILYALNKESQNRTRIKRLFTALRGVMASAFAQLYPEATAQFWNQFTPDHCVTRPFTSQRRPPKKYLPLELKSSKYVILRKKHPHDETYLNNQETTQLFKANQPLWLGFNIYTPDQFRADGTLTGRHKGTLWFRLFPTKKIRACIQRGAVVKAIRLNVPQGPSNKIVADVILGAKSRAPFCHATRFLKKWEALFKGVEIPTVTYLGSDLNRLGPYMLALGTDHQELNITPLLADIHRASRKLALFRQKIIPTLQRNLSGKTDGKNGRWATELTNVHQKRGQIMQEANRRVLMVYLYVIWQTHAQHVTWDGIEGLTPRGKKGEFAVAVQSLPNNRDQFTLFCDWLDDLQRLELVSPKIQIHLVPPFTSAVCPRCYIRSGQRNRTRDSTTDYHAFKCKPCGYTGNRHSTAARVAAITMKHAMEGLP